MRRGSCNPGHVRTLFLLGPLHIEGGQMVVTINQLLRVISVLELLAPVHALDAVLLIFNQELALIAFPKHQLKGQDIRTSSPNLCALENSRSLLNRPQDLHMRWTLGFKVQSSHFAKLRPSGTLPPLSNIRTRSCSSWASEYEAMGRAIEQTWQWILESSAMCSLVWIRGLLTCQGA